MKNTKKSAWEVDEINLNLRTYSGSPSDVIKKIKSDIEKYLSNTEVSQQTREIYSAIYCALDYYKTICYMPSPEFSTDKTFLSYCIDTFNDDFDYLSEKFGSDDPNDLPVIESSARIKSPLGFVDKVKEKIDEYVEEGRDLSYFTESLRDIMGVRLVINPPKKIIDQGEDAEVEFEYKILYDLLVRHGINKEESEYGPNDFRFIPVNTRHNPNKLESIKRRPAEKGFTKAIQDKLVNIFIPSHRIPEIDDNPKIDAVLKDYVRWPKYTGYQSIHTCVVPSFSKNIQFPKLPNCIIPQATNDLAIEYQIRTKKQHEFAERGPASHKFTYKPDETRYHRLAVPFFIEADNPSEANTTKSTNIASFFINKAKLKLRNFAESYKKHYGHSFKDRFNIPFEEFRDTFSSKERDDILSGLKIVKYNKEIASYYLEDAPREVFIDDSEILVDIAGTKENITNLFEQQGISDGVIAVSEESTTVTSPNLVVIPVESSNHREAIKELSNLEKDKEPHSENNAKKSSLPEGPDDPDEPSY